MSFKMAIIGAGSLVFARTLFTDIMSVPEFHDIEVAFTDINPDNLPPFPTEEDKSGAGILYYIHPLSSYEHLNTLDSRVNMAVDQSVYLAWLEPVLGNARPLELEYLPLTEENINRLK